jgi:predicted ATPase
MKKQRTRKEPSIRIPRGRVTGLIVGGYKSLSKPHTVDIAPLTILAGANSSGKSSIMQPMLLLKQTLEASYDAGALLLSGPNVRFTSAGQLLWRGEKGEKSDGFHMAIEVAGQGMMWWSFGRQPNKKGFRIRKMTFVDDQGEFPLSSTMSHANIMEVAPEHLKRFFKHVSKDVEKRDEKVEWVVRRSRCFLGLELLRVSDKGKAPVLTQLLSPSDVVEPHIRNLIHVPGLRGNSERAYPTTAVGPRFPGTFEQYVASVLAQWQADKDDRVKQTGEALCDLGLTWKVIAKPISDAQVELYVGRLSKPVRGGARDMVSIADVGFGVSQILPVVVALFAARPGQMVYLEQPEIHLHPCAKRGMARLLTDAAKRGVTVIAETHSALLLRGIQTQVAKGDFPSKHVKLYWFRRKPEDGATVVYDGTLDREGAYGDWPTDFDEVALEADREYLDAADSASKR